MKRSIAELITRDPEKFAHHDRVFKNNPVVMQGMGLAPLVVLATTGKNALMLPARHTSQIPLTNRCGRHPNPVPQWIYGRPSTSHHWLTAHS